MDRYLWRKKNLYTNLLKEFGDTQAKLLSWLLEFSWFPTTSCVNPVLIYLPQIELNSKVIYQINQINQLHTIIFGIFKVMLVS